MTRWRQWDCISFAEVGGAGVGGTGREGMVAREVGVST